MNRRTFFSFLGGLIASIPILGRIGKNEEVESEDRGLWYHSGQTFENYGEMNYFELSDENLSDPNFNLKNWIREEIEYQRILRMFEKADGILGVS